MVEGAWKDLYVDLFPALHHIDPELKRFVLDKVHFLFCRGRSRAYVGSTRRKGNTTAVSTRSILSVVEESAVEGELAKVQLAIGEVLGEQPHVWLPAVHAIA